MQTNNRVGSLKPMAVSTNEGEARWWLGSLAVIKATSADTDGHLTIIEVTEPPGAAAPLHIHHREDEAFWILEGNVTFEVGSDIINARTGDYVFAPRDIPHRYTVGDAGCRMLFILTPGGFENMVMALSEPAASRTLPPPSDVEPDFEKICAIAESYGIDVMG